MRRLAIFLLVALQACCWCVSGKLMARPSNFESDGDLHVATTYEEPKPKASRKKMRRHKERRFRVTNRGKMGLEEQPYRLLEEAQKDPLPPKRVRGLQLRAAEPRIGRIRGRARKKMRMGFLDGIFQGDMVQAGAVGLGLAGAAAGAAIGAGAVTAGILCATNTICNFTAVATPVPTSSTSTSAPTNPTSTSAPTGKTATTSAPTGPTATTSAPTGPTATTSAPTGPTATTSAPTGPTATTSAPTGPTATTSAPTGPTATTSAPTVMGRISNLESQSAGPTIVETSGILEFTIAASRAPDAEEMKGVMDQVRRFYEIVLSSVYPSNFESVTPFLEDAAHILVFPSMAADPVLTTSLYYKATLALSNVRTEKDAIGMDTSLNPRGQNIGGDIPTPEMVNIAIEKADLNVFLVDYIVKADPDTSLFRSTTAIAVKSTTAYEPPYEALIASRTKFPTLLPPDLSKSDLALDLTAFTTSMPHSPIFNRPSPLPSMTPADLPTTILPSPVPSEAITPDSLVRKTLPPTFPPPMDIQPASSSTPQAVLPSSNSSLVDETVDFSSTDYERVDFTDSGEDSEPFDVPTYSQHSPGAPMQPSVVEKENGAINDKGHDSDPFEEKEDNADVGFMYGNEDQPQLEEGNENVAEGDENVDFGNGHEDDGAQFQARVGNGIENSGLTGGGEDNEPQFKERTGDNYENLDFTDDGDDDYWNW